MNAQLQQMAASIIFDDAAALARAIPVLIEAGFKVQYLKGRFDPCGTPCVWALIWTRISEEGFFDCIENLFTPLGGYVEEFDEVNYIELARWRARDNAALDRMGAEYCRRFGTEGQP